MSSNKRAKEDLIRLYGAECFIENLGLRDTSEFNRAKEKRKTRERLKEYYNDR